MQTNLKNRSIYEDYRFYKFGGLIENSWGKMRISKYSVQVGTKEEKKIDL